MEAARTSEMLANFNVTTSQKTNVLCYNFTIRGVGRFLRNKFRLQHTGRPVVLCVLILMARALR
jgi:hypothetical protein